MFNSAYNHLRKNEGQPRAHLKDDDDFGHRSSHSSNQFIARSIQFDHRSQGVPVLSDAPDVQHIPHPPVDSNVGAKKTPRNPYLKSNHNSVQSVSSSLFLHIHHPILQGFNS
jgi:hypothetical protein